MQIVIDIDDDLYVRLFDNGGNNVMDMRRACVAIRKGTPLPKGHGKIGDLDALREEVSSWGMNDYEPSDFIDEIDRADTIIEADMESEDKE